MKNFQTIYKGKVLVCTPVTAQNGGWLTSLYIQEEIGNITQEKRFYPDDKIYQSPEEAAAVAESFGKRVIDEKAV